jgi:Ca2+-transporting ATPase
MVRRSAKRHLTVSADLVPGDIVLLQSGDLVPADARLITADDVTVDESMLTGESIPVGKVSDFVLAEATAVGDRRNMLHAGTMVLAGRAAGIVTQIGLHTELGQIA